MVKKRSQQMQIPAINSVRAIRAAIGTQIRSEMIRHMPSFRFHPFPVHIYTVAATFVSSPPLFLVMTEYDYSPEAIDAYVKKQQKIGRWVNDTKRHPPANPFTPATPAVHASEVGRERSHASERQHRRRVSHDKRYDTDRDKDRARARDPSSEGDGKRDRKYRAKHNRSASYSTTNARPEPFRSRTLPQPLQLGPYQNNFTSATRLPSPTYPHYPYAPRDSNHSSHTSSSTFFQPLSSYHSQATPHSAPVIPRQPVRSQTVPLHYGYPAYPNKSMGYLPVRHIYPSCANCTDPKFCSLIQNAPQLPHSYYQSKPPPLLKRIFMSLTGSSSKQRLPRRKRSFSF